MSDPKPPSLGSRVRAARERAGIAQEQLARDAGTTNTTISRLERGAIGDPKSQLLGAIARRLDVTVEWLMTGEESAGTPPAAPDPPHWQEFLEKYEHVGEFDAGQLADIKGFSARQIPVVRSWMDYALVAETVRRARPSAIFEAKKAEREAQKKGRGSGSA